MTILGGVPADATPLFTNPNFQSTTSTTTFMYSVPITGWTDVSGGGSATGIAARYAPAVWDNGVAPGSLTNVVFLQNETSSLQQMVGGFTIGDRYQITIAADARAATGQAGLGIEVNGTEFGGLSLSPTPVSAVDPSGIYATPWANYTSAVFKATAASNLIQFQNLGIPGSAAFDDVTLDLANARITDVTQGVPEPGGLALLALGLGGCAFALRRVKIRRSYLQDTVRAV